MLKAFEKKLRLVRLRCSLNILLEQTGRVLTAAGAAVVLAVLGERLLALSLINYWTFWIFSGAVAAGVFLSWLLDQPSRLRVSLLLDERLRLHERFSTTLALADSQDPFACAARAEARETARHISPKEHFPIRPSRCWLYAVCTWLVAVILVLFLPQKDLLGFLRNRQQQQQQTKQIELAKADVKQTTSTVKSALKQLDNPDLDDALTGLDQMPRDAKPDDIKRQAIRRLGDLSDKLKNMQSGMQLDSVNLMQQMLKQLRGSPDAFAQKLRLALAQGNFAQAASLLKELQKELVEGKLSEQQREALAQQLQELAKQLQELAAKNEQLEKELEKQGLDKNLARLDEQQLRQALQKQGLSPEKIQQLLQKAAACRMACSRCAGLGEGMASCGMGAGGLSADELANLAGQLDELESLQQQVMLTQAALDEIARACAGLGQGMCEGLGCQGPFREGLSDRYGPGTGGPGIGYGPRATDNDGETSTKSTKLQSEPKQGPVIASWYFKGPQIKGEAKRDFAEVMQAARDSAAEAISENQIPRKYEEAVKKYFGQLEQSGNQ
ncbi:MAG TPA: hypothetical protein VMW16_10350 [Sedimentisphaerales bacterium]|nr:hypothetical protein [Sedimentisphaerales bacterium]